MKTMSDPYPAPDAILGHFSGVSEMDPNQALKELRELMNRDSRSTIDAYDMLSQAQALFQYLDQWLSSGGFPPGDWIKVRDLMKEKK